MGFNKDGGLDLEFRAPLGTRFTTGEWRITRGEVPMGGVYIGTLAGGYTIWADLRNGGSEGTDDGTAALIRAAPIMLSALVTIMEGDEMFDRPRVPLSGRPIAAMQPSEEDMHASVILTKLRVRAAIKTAMKPLTDEEETT